MRYLGVSNTARMGAACILVLSCLISQAYPNPAAQNSKTSGLSALPAPLILLADLQTDKVATNEVRNNEITESGIEGESLPNSEEEGERFSTSGGGEDSFTPSGWGRDSLPPSVENLSELEESHKERTAGPTGGQEKTTFNPLDNLKDFLSLPLTKNATEFHYDQLAVETDHEVGHSVQLGGGLEDGEDRGNRDLEVGEDLGNGRLEVGEDQDNGDLEGGEDQGNGGLEGGEDQGNRGLEGGEDQGNGGLEGGEDRGNGGLEGVEGQGNGDLEVGEGWGNGDLENGEDQNNGGLEGGEDWVTQQSEGRTENYHIVAKAGPEVTISSIISETATTEDTISSIISETATTEDKISSIISETATTEDTISSIISETATTEDTISSIISETATTEDTISSIFSETSTTEDTISSKISETATTEDTISSIISETATTASPVHPAAEPQMTPHASDVQQMTPHARAVQLESRRESFRSTATGSATARPKTAVTPGTLSIVEVQTSSTVDPSEFAPIEDAEAAHVIEVEIASVPQDPDPDIGGGAAHPAVDQRHTPEEGWNGAPEEGWNGTPEEGWNGTPEYTDDADVQRHEGVEQVEYVGDYIADYPDYHTAPSGPSSEDYLLHSFPTKSGVVSLEDNRLVGGEEEAGVEDSSTLDPNLYVVVETVTDPTEEGESEPGDLYTKEEEVAPLVVEDVLNLGEDGVHTLEDEFIHLDPDLVNQIPEEIQHPLIALMDVQPHSMRIQIKPNHFQPKIMIRLLYERVPRSKSPLMNHLDSPVIEYIPLYREVQEFTLDNLPMGKYIVCAEAQSDGHVIQNNCFETRVERLDNNKLQSGVIAVIAVAILIVVSMIIYAIYYRINTIRKRNKEKTVEEKVETVEAAPTALQKIEKAKSLETNITFTTETYEERCIM